MQNSIMGKILSQGNRIFDKYDKGMLLERRTKKIDADIAETHHKTVTLQFYLNNLNDPNTYPAGA